MPNPNWWIKYGIWINLVRQFSFGAAKGLSLTESVELLSNLSWAWHTVRLLNQMWHQWGSKVKLRFGTWQVRRLNQALFYLNSNQGCCFYSIILNCLIDSYCSQCSFRLLVLHLKRYEYDNLTEEQAKKQDKVNIERFIDLSKCQGYVLEVNHVLHILCRV